MKGEIGTHHITRKKYKGRTTGFQVRLQYSCDYPISKSFYISKYKSLYTALVVAIEFRDAEIKQLVAVGEYPIDKHRVRLQKNNRSGIVGVRRIKTWTKVNGVSVESGSYRWEATWVKNRKAQKSTFSEDKYGAAKAKKMAIDCRNARKSLYR